MIKVPNLSSPAYFYLKGKISQNSGEDWMDTQIILMSWNLSNINQPVLKQWRHNFHKAYRMMADSSYTMLGASSTLPGGTVEKASNLYESESLPDVKLMAEKSNLEMLTTYILPSKQNIYAGNTSSMIDITHFTLPAEYVYTTIPKANSYVFLNARIDTKNISDLYECGASLYLGNTYVGETKIQIDPLKDHMDLSLGKDQEITVSRNNVRKERKRTIIGNNVNAIFEYEIKVKNLKKEKVNIQIIDQIPVSPTSKIKITNVNLSQGTLDQETGEVKWLYAFEPGVQGTLHLSYTISWPKDEQLDL